MVNKDVNIQLLCKWWWMEQADDTIVEYLAHLLDSDGRTWHTCWILMEEADETIVEYLAYLLDSCCKVHEQT